MKNYTGVANDSGQARMRAAFEAILQPQDAQPHHDPNREVSLRDACELLKLTRLTFKKKYEDRLAKIKRGEVINDALVPKPHLNACGHQCFWQWQIDAYVDATKSAG